VHAPGYLRDAFIEWVGRGANEATVTVGWDEESWPVVALFDALRDCSDIMPSDVCADLDLEPGTSYGEAVHATGLETRV
jgi:hypothetical protein